MSQIIKKKEEPMNELCYEIESNFNMLFFKIGRYDYFPRCFFTCFSNLKFETIKCMRAHFY